MFRVYRVGCWDWKPPAELRPEARPGLGIRDSGPARARRDVLASIFSAGSDTQVSGEMFLVSGFRSEFVIRVRLFCTRRVLWRQIPLTLPLRYAYESVMFHNVAALAGSGCLLEIIVVSTY